MADPSVLHVGWSGQLPSFPIHCCCSKLLVYWPEGGDDSTYSCPHDHLHNRTAGCHAVCCLLLCRETKPSIPDLYVHVVVKLVSLPACHTLPTLHMAPMAAHMVYQLLCQAHRGEDITTAMMPVGVGTYIWYKCTKCFWPPLKQMRSLQFASITQWGQSSSIEVHLEAAVSTAAMP